MRLLPRLSGLLSGLAGLAVLATASADDAEALRNWPQWRGPNSTGVAPHADPPIEWSEDHNLRWKTALPGRGHSTPIVWDDLVFVCAAIPYGPRLDPRPETAPGAHDNLPVTRRHRFVVIGLRRSDGEIVWQREVSEALPHEGGHYTGSLASHSPVTDGQHVWAFFGSRGLYCLDFQGRIQWKTAFGDMLTKHGHGEGASPALYGDTLVINWDHRGQSFVVALDKRTGKQRWRVERDEVTSWATPIIVEQEGRPQLIVSGTDRVRAYDLENGAVIWECGGLSANVVASPVAGNGMVFAASSYDTRALLAIRLDGGGRRHHTHQAGRLAP